MKKLLVLALLATLLVTVRAPGAEAAGKQAALATSYACTSDVGSGSAGVVVRTRLPRTVRASGTVAERRLAVRLEMPEDLVDAMRQYGVTSVTGAAPRTLLRVGKQRVPVRRLRIPRTEVPSSGALVLRGAGRLSSFTAPAVGRYSVRVPRRLTADLVAYFDAETIATTMTCAVAEGAPTRLSTLRVKA